VKPEQALKVTMRMPTLLPLGEGRMSGEAIDTRTRSIRRGRPVKGEGSQTGSYDRRGRVAPGLRSLHIVVPALACKKPADALEPWLLGNLA
jgi:hypothetical protein